MSYVATRSPRFHSRFLGVTIMWWPQKPQRLFRIRKGNRVLFVVNIGHVEILVG